MDKRIKGWIPVLLAAKRLHDRTGNDVYYVQSGQYSYYVTDVPDKYPNQVKFNNENLNRLTYKSLGGTK